MKWDRSFFFFFVLLALENAFVKVFSWLFHQGLRSCGHPVSLYTIESIPLNAQLGPHSVCWADHMNNAPATELLAAGDLSRLPLCMVHP